MRPDVAFGDDELDADGTVPSEPARLGDEPLVLFQLN
jgi:hypothetical protein